MFTWKKDLVVGLQEIDDEHKELFYLFRSLSSEIDTGKDLAIIESAVVYLSNYTQEHFEKEERYMKDFKYPAKQEQEHKKEHKKFKKDFSRLKTHMRNNGNAELRSLQLEGVVHDWFVSHIQRTDRKLATFHCKKL